MSKISMMLDNEALDYNPDMHDALFQDFDEHTTVVELYRKMEAIYNAYEQGLSRYE